MAKQADPNDSSGTTKNDAANRASASSQRVSVTPKVSVASKQAASQTDISFHTKTGK